MWMLAAAGVIGGALGAYYVTSRRVMVQSHWPKETQSLPYTRKVQAKKRKIQLPLNSLDDFTPMGEMQPVTDVAAFFTSHGNEFSVYSIDWERESVVLVRPADGADLKRHPFFREAQRRSAAEILSIPFSHLQDVVDAIQHKTAHVQNFFVYMTGRCGSTLLTRAVEATSVAQAANEPELFSIINMAVLRARRSKLSGRASRNPSVHPSVMAEDYATVKLLRNVVALLNYHLVMADPQHRDVIVYKLKMGVLIMGDLMYRAFPAAKTIFMFRNGMECFESWMKLWFRSRLVYSLLRSLVRLGLWRWAPGVPDYFRCFGDDPKFAGQFNGSGIFYAIAIWVGTMHRALELQKKHPSYFFHAVLDYNALTVGKEESLRLLLKKLGLNWKPDDHEEDAEKIRMVFEEDSQAGTFVSVRTKKPGEKWTQPSFSWLGDWEREYISVLCRTAGNEITSPDFLFPGTMS